MADLLTLSDTKLHLRVDGSTEDALIQSMMAAATQAACDYLNVESLDDTAAAPVKSAVLLLVGTLYEMRESMAEKPFYRNPVFESLLNPYRVHA